MPKQGQSVESCILTEFKKKKGDSVAVGDILFSYETDKASFEEAAQVAGTVLDVFFDNGDEIPVLTNVMVIGNEGESTAEFRPSRRQPLQRLRQQRLRLMPRRPPLRHPLRPALRRPFRPAPRCSRPRKPSTHRLWPDRVLTAA